MQVCRLSLVLLLAFALTSPLAAQPSGGTAVIAVAVDPGHLNPAISTAGPLHAVAGSLFNGLVALDEAGNPEQDLAVSWAVAADGLSVTFNLRPGVRWHDGQAFTARDVKVSFEQLLLRFHARARAGLAPAVAGIDAPDPLTVVFRLHRPHPALLRQLDVTEAPILPAHLFAGTDPTSNPANARPIGTGPFRFESHRHDDQVVLTRNPDYFRPGLPRLDRLVFRIIPEANTQVNALLAGEVDMLAGLGPPLLDEAVMRLAEITVGLPVLLLAVLVAALFGGSAWNLALLLGLTRWPVIARIVRMEVRSLLGREFLQAAWALGAPALHVARRHLLPHLIGPVLAAAGIVFGGAVVAEAALAFVGLGDPAVTSWGQMVAAGFVMQGLAWWVWLWPAVMLVAVSGLVAVAADFHPRGR